MAALDFADSPPNLTPDKPLAPKAKAPVAAEPAKPEEKPTPPAKPYDPTAGIGKGMEKASREIQALDAESMRLNVPKLTQAPKPEPKMTSPIEQWGSYAMIFAALGGLLSRNHMTTALNSATAVMEGFKKKDAAATDEAMKMWETENKNAMDLINFQNNAYNQALGNIRHKEDLAYKRGSEEDKTAEAKVKALSAAFQDATIIEAYNRGGMPEVAKLQKQREDGVESMKRFGEEAKAGASEARARQELVASDEYKAARPEDRQEMVYRNYAKFHNKSPESGAADPKDVQVVAQKLKDYRQDPPSGFMLKNSPLLKAAYTEALKDPDYNEAKAKTVAAGRKELQQGKSGQTLRSLMTARDHLGYLEFLSKDLPNGANIQAFNRSAASISAQFGHPEVTTFEAAKQIVGPEIIKAIVGAQGGQAEREEAKKLFDNAETPEQMTGAFTAVRDLLGAQAVNIVDKQFKAIPHSVMEEYVDMKSIDKYRADMAAAESPEKKGADPSVKAEGGDPVAVKEFSDAVKLPNGVTFKAPNGKTYTMSDAIRDHLSGK